MNSLLLQLGIVVLVLTAALIIALPADAQTLDLLAPDAALVAQSGAGETIDGASWSVATVHGHRLWADLIDPRGTWGLGASADLSPGGAACVGGGWREGFVVYYGLHF
jgi:hypothetical protein